MAQEPGRVYCFPSDGQDPAAYCEMAKRWNLDTILILGEDRDGSFVWGGNTLDQKELVWLLQTALQEVMRET